MIDLASLFTGGQQSQPTGPVYNFPQRDPRELYTQNGDLMNSQNHMQRVATPAAWQDIANRNFDRSQPIEPSIMDYISLFADMMGPRIPYEDASTGSKRALNRGARMEAPDPELQRIWGTRGISK